MEIQESGSLRFYYRHLPMISPKEIFPSPVEVAVSLWSYGDPNGVC